MSVSLKVESLAFTDALRRYKREVSSDTEQYILQQSGLFISDMVKFSFPKKQKHGRLAVERDLARAVKPLRQKGTKRYQGAFDDIQDVNLRNRLNKLLLAKNYQAIEKIMKTWKGHKKVEIVPFRPALHARARDARGRVNVSTGRMTPDIKAWNRHLRMKQKRVGLHKHGWVGAARRLRARGVIIKIPDWVEKNKAAPSGRGNFIGTGDRFVFEMRNPYPVPGADATMKFVMGLRAKKMNAGINRILRENAKKRGFGVR